MKSTYSYDLRERVVAAIDEGMGKTEAAKVFKIGERSIYRWLDLRTKTGDISAKKEWRKGHSHKIKDLEEFKKFAQENCYLSQKEMARKWGNITGSTICSYLKKINFTKKNIKLIP